MTIKISITSDPTKGKTTVAHLIAAALIEAGLTVDYDPPGDLGPWHTDGTALDAVKRAGTRVKIVEVTTAENPRYQRYRRL